MPDLQDTLLDEFEQIQGAIGDSSEAWNSGGQAGGGQAAGGQRDTAPRGNVDSLGDQTGRLDYPGRRFSSSSSAAGGTVSDVGGALAGGLGSVPLGLELAHIFGGGPSTPPPLTYYAMPDSIGFVGSTDDSGANTDADFGQTGQPRSYGTPAAQSSSTGSQSQPVQITVQAMDAQSIMDRSDDIASAVNK